MNHGMAFVRTQLSFAGYTEERVKEGLPHLIEMLKSRSWLLNTMAFWDTRRKRLVVAVESKGSNPKIFEEPSDDEWEEPSRNGGANWDEINECVDACFLQGEADINITVDESIVVTRPVD